MSRRIRSILIAIAREDLDAPMMLRSLSVDDLSVVIELAIAHGLSATTIATLRRGDLAVPTRLEDQRFTAMGARIRLRAGLGILSQAMEQAGFPWSVLKGPVLAAHYPDPLARSYRDLDILVEGSSIIPALEALGRVGSKEINQNWEACLDYGLAEFPVQYGSTVIDLHWHLVGYERSRRDFELDISAMLARSRLIEAEGAVIRSLDPEDTLINVALHSGLSGGNRLSQLRDVHHLTTSEPIDWDLAIQRATANKTASLVGHVLDRTRRIMRTDAIPREVPVSLAGRSGLRTRGIMERWPRSTSRMADGIDSGFLIAVSRASRKDSLRATARVAGLHIRRLAGNPKATNSGNPDSEVHWARPRGGDEARLRYLEYAAGAGVSLEEPRARTGGIERRR